MNTLLIQQAKNMIDSKISSVGNLCNLFSLCFYTYDAINWIGLYICDDQKARCILGPFQGTPACTIIPYGKGVVGQCAINKATFTVDDVHQFPGHIACDSKSSSELVIPIIKNKKIYAILDIDSLKKHYFDPSLVKTFEAFSSLIVELLDNESNDKL